MERQQEEQQSRDLFEGEESDYNAAQECGHRSPNDMLPEEETERYFLWCVCGKDPRTMLWAEEHLTMLELMEFFAFQRVDLYIGTEDEYKSQNE